jgi:hypothetical protein
MFSANLRNYVFRGNQRRLRDDRISLAIAFAFSMLTLALGQPERTAAIAGGVVLGISMLSLTLYFCGNVSQINASLRSASSSRAGILYRPVSRRLATTSALSLSALFTMPAIGAAVLDRRIRKAIQAAPLDQSSIDKIRQTLHDASTYGIRLPSSTISAVQATLRKTSEAAPPLSRDAMMAAAAAASNSTLDIGLPPDFHGQMFDRLPEAKGSSWSFVPMATNTGPDSYAHIGIAREPDVAKMELINKPIAVASSYGPAFFVAKGMTATLDGWHLKHIVFQEMKFTYNGGPLVLESVFFFNCQVECVPGENSWDLVLAISKGGWVSLRLK